MTTTKNTHRPPIRITPRAYDHLKASALAERKANGPTSMKSLASAAILKLGAPQPHNGQAHFILMGFHGLADENCVPDLLVCSGIVGLIKAMNENPHFVYAEVLRVLPDGRTERLGNDPNLEEIKA